MKWTLLASALLLAPAAFADPMCVPGTLTSYIALQPGCQIGPILNFEGFGFSVASSAGGAVAGSTDNIFVTPKITPGSAFGVDMDFTGFSVTSGQSISYLLTYTIDEPPIIRGYTTNLSDPPTPPAFTLVVTELCLGAPFDGATCPNPAIVQVLSDSQGRSVLQASNTFSPVGVLGVRTTITLDASQGGFADILGYGGSAVVPEPASAAITGAGLLLLASFLRRRAAR